MSLQIFLSVMHDIVRPLVPIVQYTVVNAFIPVLCRDDTLKQLKMYKYTYFPSKRSGCYFLLILPIVKLETELTYRIEQQPLIYRFALHKE